MAAIAPELVYREAEGVPRGDTWKAMSLTAFTLSPRGGGLDCHRTWEALVLGSVPVVKSSPLDPLYAGLPVLVVGDWTELTVERLRAFGVNEIAVKNGPNGALVASAGASELVPVPEVVTPIDVTAAGDGFNAGYLAARLARRSAIEAASAAHRLAGQVIRHRGAIVPRSGAAVH